MKSVDELRESVTSEHQWLLAANEHVVKPVTYERADHNEILSQLGEQEASPVVFTVCS